MQQKLVYCKRKIGEMISLYFSCSVSIYKAEKNIKNTVKIFQSGKTTEMSSNCHQSSTQTGSPMTCLAPNATWHRSKAKFISQNLRDTSCSRLQLKKYQQKATPPIGQKSCKSAKCHQKIPLRITVSERPFLLLLEGGKLKCQITNVCLSSACQSFNYIFLTFSSLGFIPFNAFQLPVYVFILYCSILKPAVGIKQTCLFSHCGVVLLCMLYFLSVVILKFSAKQNRKMQELNIATLKK